MNLGVFLATLSATTLMTGTPTRVCGPDPDCWIREQLNVAITATKSARPDWTFPGAPSSPSSPSKQGIDEMAHYDRVIADVSRRFPVDTNQMMANRF